ncbi:MAG: response regulator [Planctomycetes bacterium]|nr:response regulator [Planctomycetota bacterium]
MKLGLQGKYALSILVLCLLTAAVPTWSAYRWTKEAIRNGVQERFARSADLIHTRLQAILLERVASLQLLADMRGIRDADASTAVKEEALRGIARGARQFRRIAVSDAKGNLVASTDRVGGREGDALWFRHCILGRTYVSDVHYSPLDRGMVLTLAIPVREGNEPPTGVILGELDMRKVWWFADPDANGRPLEVFLVNTNGRVVGHSLRERVFEDFGEHPAVRLGKSEIPKTRLFQDSAGIEWLCSYLPVQGEFHPAETQWWLLVQQPAAGAFSEAARLGTWLGLLSIAIVLVAVWLSFVVGGKLVEPIRRLRDGVGRVTRKDLSGRVDVRTHDEVQDLAEDFNKMSDSLRESYATLERKVDERTRELADALSSSAEVARQLGVVNQSTREMTQFLKQEPVLATAASALVTGFGAREARVWLLGPGDRCSTCPHARVCPDRTQCLHLAASAPNDVPPTPDVERIPIGLFGPGKVAVDSQVATQARTESGRPETWIGLPLLVGSRLLGVLGATAPRVVSHDTVDILRSFAHQTAVTLSDVRQLEAATIQMHKLNHIIESIGDGVFTTDEAARITSWNSAAERITGFGRSQVLGRLPGEVLGGPPDTSSDTSVTRRVTGAATVERFEGSAAGGRRVQLAACRSPITDASGHSVGTVVVFRDITREAEIDRMKTEFISTVSHELRTPLTSIKGYVDLILGGDTGDVNDLQKEFLEIVGQNTTRLANLITDLLDIEKIESGKITMRRERLDLSRILRDVTATFRVMAQNKQLALESRIAEGLEILGDRDRLLQVVSNLVSNSIKYTKQGQVSLAGEQGEGVVRVRLRDTGVGIGAEDQKKLFTRFFRADNAYAREVGGTGLGLSIVKAIVDQHGGEISLTSELGHGSEFLLTFPSLPSEEAMATLGTEKEARVLVVYDDPRMADQVTAFARSLGCLPKVLRRGADALRAAREERPDLLVLDVKMPDMDGWDLLAHVRRDPETRKVPVLFVTEGEVSEVPARQGYQEYLARPVSAERLHSAAVRAATRGGRCLVVDADAAAVELARSTLVTAGFDVQSVATSALALRWFGGGRPALVLLALEALGEAGSADRSLLLDEMERQSVPVLFLGEAARIGDARERARLLGAAGLVSRSEGMERILAAMRGALRRGRPDAAAVAGMTAATDGAA